MKQRLDVGTEADQPPSAAGARVAPTRKNITGGKAASMEQREVGAQAQAGSNQLIFSQIDAMGRDAVARMLQGVDSAAWNDWHWQMLNRITSIQDLSQMLGLKPYELSRYRRLISTFRFSITPYYMSLINWSDPEDPIRKQCVPDLRELDYQLVGDDDPLEEEKDMQAPGLVHRYPDRVLAVVTSTCSMYCRHCTRKRIWHKGEGARSKEELQGMINYVARTPEVREVVVSGGDPLTMNIDLLDWFLFEMRRIPHVEVMRIGTRVPVVLPMRVDTELTTMLKRHRPLWINTQFNHPREITPEAAEACDRLVSAGIPVSNQSVLLKGINDSVETMKELCQSLQRILVRPYYLYQCDPVVGVEHFRTNIGKGVEIIEMMRGYTGGLCVPTFVIDAPGGGGKIPIQPFYLLSLSEKEVLLRNYEGMIVKYYNPQESDSASTGRRRSKSAKNGTTGTAQLLSGHKSALVPEDNPRYSRRKKKAASSGDEGANLC